MTRVSFGRVALCLAVAFWLGGAAARAQEAGGRDLAACDGLRELPGRLTDPALRIEEIHRGLRSMLEDPNRALSDNRLGPYTREALRLLCLRVPLDPSVAAVPGTLALAQDYGEVAQPNEGWRRIAADPALRPRLTATEGQGITLLPLQLAGPPALARSALLDGRRAPACPQVNPSTLDPGQNAVLQALNRASEGQWPTLSSLCPVLLPPVAAGADAETTGLSATLDHYAGLERALPGALKDLISVGFARWLVERQDDRVPRLMGSAPAVLALLREYRAATPPEPGPAPTPPGPEPTPAPAPARVTALDYFAVEAADLAAIDRALSVKLDLDCLAGRNFPTEAALKQEVLAATNASLGLSETGGCTPKAPPDAKTAEPAHPAAIWVADRVAADVGRAVAGSPTLRPQDFFIDEARLNGLLLEPATAPSVPAIAALAKTTAGTRAELEQAIEAAIRGVVSQAMEVQVTTAADAVAGAAEPVDPGLDSRPEGVPEFPDLPASAPIGVTEGTDAAMMVMVPDRDLSTALLSHDFAPAANPDLLKAEVRQILHPIATEKVDKAVAEAMALIVARGVVTERWTLTPELVAAIRSASTLPPAPAVRVRLEPLVGLAYPYRGLFVKALDDALADTGAPGAAEGVEAVARSLALTVAPHHGRPGGLADALDLGAKDCGCRALRGEDAEVYGFYPFWRLSAEDGSFDRQGVSRINFSLLNRVALYGIEISDRLPAGANKWLAGVGPGLVRAAHLYRAKADYAVTLAGWQAWSPERIAEVADQVAALAQTAGGAEAATARPDGVTLIFPGYPGATPPSPGGRGAECRPEDPCWRTLLLVREVKSRLRPDQSLNIALDMVFEPPPAGQASQSYGPLDELCSILTDPKDCVVDGRPQKTPVPRARADAASGEPLVDLVLVFLPRPTSDTKKYLRAGLDWGIYHGESRETVLRHILPVVPPPAVPGDAVVPIDTLDEFTTELVYYQDNFGGVGFWPAPDPANAAEPKLWDGFRDVKLGERDDRDIVGAQWVGNEGLPFWVPLASTVRGACVLICPNRLYLGLAAGAVAGFVLLLVVASFISGMTPLAGLRRGLTAVGIIAVAVVLAALSVCDPGAVVAPVCFAGLMLGVFCGAVLTAYQVARNGPMP